MSGRAVRRDRIAYGGAPSQFGHLYVPAEPDRGSPAQLVVLLHGGSWSDEYALTVQSAIARDLAERGMAVWNLEYRRIGEPGGGWPGTGADVLAGLAAVSGSVAAALRDRNWPLDRTGVSVVGHSAGGQLAVWAAARTASQAGDVPIDTVIAQSAVLDLVAAADRPSVRALMGRSFTDDPGRYRDASPAHQPVTGAHIIALHAAADTVIVPAVSEAYVRDARLRGQSAELVLVPGEGHDAFVDPRSAVHRRTVRLLEAARAIQ